MNASPGRLRHRLQGAVRWLVLRGAPLALLAAARIARPDTLVVYGAWEASYQVSAEFPVPLRSYQGGAFQQHVQPEAQGFHVRVSTQPGAQDLDTPHPTDAQPSRNSCCSAPEANPSPPQSQPPSSATPTDASSFLQPIEPLPPEARAELLRLGSTCTTRREMVEGVLDWLTRRIRIADSAGQPQTPTEVLDRRSGNCVGLTRTAVAMLRQAGIPARSLHGFRLQLQNGRVSGGAFHRMLEVEYPGLGWVASDVGRTKNFLPPDILILAVEGQQLAPEDRLVEAQPRTPPWTAIQNLGSQRELLTLDQQGWPEDRRIYTAWSRGHRLSKSVILGTLEGAPQDLEMVAVGARGPHTPSRAGAWFAFSGLLPGQYTLRFRTPEGTASAGPWRINEREMLRIRLDLGRLQPEGPLP